MGKVEISVKKFVSLFTQHRISIENTESTMQIRKKNLPAVWTSNGFTILALRGEKTVGEGVIVSSQFLIM